MFGFRKSLMVFWLTGIVLVSIFIVFLTVRDTRLISIARVGQSSEFTQIALLCSDYPMCLRIIPSIIGHFSIYLTWYVAKLFSISPDPFLSNPITYEERFTFVSLSISLIFRVSIFILIFLLVYRFSNSYLLSNSVFICFLITLIAPQTSILKIILAQFEFSPSQEQWLYSMPQIYLIYYDYFALLLVVLFVLQPRFLIDKSSFSLFVIGTLLFLSFEFLPLFAYLLVNFLERRRILSKYLFLLLGPALIMIFLVLFGPSKSSLLTTISYYAISNLSNIPGIVLISVVVLVPPILLGEIMGHILSRFSRLESSNELTVMHAKSKAAAKSLITVHGLSVFTSGITSEFARQSLALQFILLLLFCTRPLVTLRIRK